ncbi:MAG: FtsX-like permease family protein [Woeseiaceae bacterium]|nr:FtsX-like permease family protein [Woeseiaceae bacterium]
MIGALNKKLLRDLWHLKGQVVSIALVIASGIALLVMSLSTYESLRATSDAYFDRYRFGDVFTTVKRAPLRLDEQIKSLEGVQTTQLRIAMPVTLDVGAFAEPLMGRLVSIPEGRQPNLNRLVLRSGRLVEPGRTDEVIINHAFAEAHELHAGDTIAAIINGKKRRLDIVGTAASPEFIYIISPFALMPDKKRYGILWMGRKSLEAAFDYEGAFNDLSLTVLRGTDTRQTVQALDALLAPYGATGAVDRDDHLSYWFIQNELEQNKASARVLPTIFLLVAAFLTNTVLSRLIITERTEIGLMKAFGYSNSEVGWHYAKFVIAITIIGILLGWVLGAILGRISTESYATNLNLPLLIYRPGPSSFVIGAFVSLAVGLIATLRAVREAASLAPVVAMSPPAPPVFKGGNRLYRRLLETLDEPTRIIARQIARWPSRALVTTAGFAGAIAMMILSLYFTDAIDEIASTHFGELQREDLALGFSDPKTSAVLHEIERLPGVISAEPMRIVSVDLVSAQRVHRGALQGLSRNAELTQIYDVKRGAVPVPDDGIVLSLSLAEKLRVEAGGELEVRVLQGRRPVARLPVVGVYESYIGMFAYTNITVLNRLLLDRPLTEFVNVSIDESSQDELLETLKTLPAVSTVAIKSVARDNFYNTIGKTLMIFVGFFGAFSFALGFGVTYNAQRIALSERGRELATLRVLGFSRGDALYILLGEATFLVCLALPLGCLLGWLLTAVFINAGGFQTELMRIPFVIRPETYGTSIVVLLTALAVSGWVMNRWIARLDMISVLKTRE